jgi:hypothetical protein
MPHRRPQGPTFTIRGRPYPVLLPKLADPRLHLAAVIISLQIIGQVGFDFELSIAQILLAIGTGCRARGRRSRCAAARDHVAGKRDADRQRRRLRPACARAPCTATGGACRGWWIYVGTAAVSLLSKHVIRWRGEHIFNPSNIGLVLCFLLLGRTRAAPLDFWWGPMSAWLVLALAIIVAAASPSSGG